MDTAEAETTVIADTGADPDPSTGLGTYIRVIEVWVPDADGALLVLGSAWYGAAKRFGMLSRQMCFGRGEGLPGQAWEAGRPVVLKQFEGSAFRRTQAAHADGLTAGIALPVFGGDTLNAVVLIFCSDNDQQAGAIELWRNEASISKDLVLDDGYYGSTSSVFEYISRRTAFRKGTGLPGLAWETGLPVFMEDLGKGGRFLRADSAQKVGINRGFAIPCSISSATPGADSYVMAFLSALATPIVRRFESWLPDTAGTSLWRREGFCEVAGGLDLTSAQDRVEKGHGVLGQAFASGVPQVSLQATTEPGGVGSGARAVGLGTVVALPVLQAGKVLAVVAWYF